MPVSLFNPPPAGYGGKADDHLLEQYKLYVDTSQKLSDRRLSTNNYLLTINSSLLTLLGLLATLLTDRRPLALIPVAGALLCAAWVLLLTSFKRLNAAKFDVILEIETHLPANVYAAEWEHVKRRKYKAMSDVERVVPWLFLVFYLFAAVFVWNWPERGEKAQRIRIESPVRVEVKRP
jgi:hypothetical protein